MGGSLLSLGAMQKHFLAALTTATLSPSYNATRPSSSSTTTTTLSYTERYLVDSCGLSMESAVSVIKKLKLLQDPRTAIQCFKAYGFTGTHIAILIEKEPWLLNCKVGSTLRPKLDFLIKIGFVGELLPKLISRVPSLLRRSLQSHLMQSHQVLRPYFDTNDKFVRAIFRNSALMAASLKPIVKNLDFLAREGIPPSYVGKLLLLSSKPITQNPQRLVDSVRIAKEMGFDPESLVFVHAVGVMARVTEPTWNHKIELLKSFGWSEQDIFIAFKRYPWFMRLSEEKIRSGLDFYINTVKLEVKDLISHPMLFSYSIHKRSRPRWNILEILKSHNLVAEDINVNVVLTRSEKIFLARYVTMYADRIPELIKVYRGEVLGQ